MVEVGRKALWESVKRRSPREARPAHREIPGRKLEWGQGHCDHTSPGSQLSWQTETLREQKDTRLVGHTGPQADRQSPEQSQQSQQLQVARALGEAEVKSALEQVTQERDDAIAKKLAVEAELGICRAKLQATEKQLLEVVKEKLVLMEEVEAWKDDMQELVSRQIQSQMQREGSDPWGDGVSGSRTQPGLTTHFSQWQWRWRRRDSGLKQMENWPPSQEKMASYFASEMYDSGQVIPSVTSENCRR
ncbi:uncharacterized protein LOC114042908 [Vombatus ursinus]|uniref:uncharacterized protein LOC114042908 n=1 Tax=Vombatus ursinus TaxID=29139 RepID=UPI000FFD0849|nr:uncharacterized protein LOC114042908 [Vombatus ursinus]